MKQRIFKLPDTETIKNKSFSITCMFFIIISLYVACYMLFFRTILVDVTKDITIDYRGESESASVVVKNLNVNYNQRIQEFMDSITYQVTPNRDLKNGDKLKITASYDEDLATRYHIDAINSVREVEVKDLPIRFDGVEQIGQPFLNTLNESGEEYLAKVMDSILDNDFTQFHISSKPELVDSKRMHRVFLKSKKDSFKDKVVDIYAIRANGKVNTSTNGESLEDKEAMIYYMISYNEVNTSDTIKSEDIYGEKVIAQSGLDLEKDSDFNAYMTSKYGRNYTMETIE